MMLALAPVCLAVEPVEKPTVLDDANGDLTRLAKGILGNNGGNQFFYFPTRNAPGTPASWGCRFENVSFKSKDQTALDGWFIPGKVDKAKGTVVFSHGNTGAIGHHLGFVIWLAEAGYNVLMYDYRGFGKSGGIVDRRGMVDDVKAAFAYAQSRSDVNADRLVSYGHSLGGAKSVTALAEAPIKGLRAIVTDGAFSSYRSMAKVIAGQFGANMVTDELAPKDYVAKLSPVPLLIVHGEKDELVPISEGRALFEAAHEPKTFFAVKSGHHGDSLSRDNGAFRKRMLTWLAESTAR
jgi:fermentation-respiration switch protein FrsA (DUF1100 family)